jgi:uncharacterized repeat protein (TIGR03847 family)
MPRSELDLNPVQHITSDAIGKPGQRVFYLQGWREADIQPVTIIIEKVQLQTLATGLEQMLTEITGQNPALTKHSAEFDADKMHISPPVDPLFRAGEMGLGYDAEKDLIVILVREIVVEDGNSEEASVVRFWCTRQQASVLAAWSLEVVQRGRPICPQCGQPMEPEGHFCPKKNGHKH